MRINYCKVLYDMTIKNDSKFENESTCQFKMDMKNLRKVDPSSQKS